MSQHEIWHGDAVDLVHKLPDNIQCVIADPPYGVNFVSYRAATPNGKKYTVPVANDASLEGAIALFFDVMIPLVNKMAEHSDLYVFTRWDIVGPWIDAVRKLPDIEYKMMLVWDKGIPGMGDIDANWGCGHEIILYCKKGRRDVPYRRSSIIAVDKVHPAHGCHPTEKPIALLEKLIEMSTNPGDLVVDPFSGSGSTIIGAQRLGRRGIGIEMEQRYVDLSRRRLAQNVMVFD